MEESITLTQAERKQLFEIFQTHPRHRVRQRAHILLLLDEGLPWATIARVLFCSPSTISRWKRRFLSDGVESLLPQTPGAGRWAFWRHLIVGWITEHCPREFGFLRTRWCCEVVVLLLWELHRITVSRETVRRCLHAENLVWRRPRPVIRREDPQREAKLRGIRELLQDLPDDEVALFQDEVDVQTNPKIGSMWMLRGCQAEVETPGDNAKSYLSGSLSWRTGEMFVTEGDKRNADLFLAHLDDLRRRLRRYRVIHVICDNAVFHCPERCRKVEKYLQRWGHRIRLHFLPKREPQSNPIERVWWHLHEEITRNHRCRSLDELVELTLEWIDARSPFAIENSDYKLQQAA